MPKSKNRRPNKKKRQRNNDLPANYSDQIKTLTAAAISIIYSDNSQIGTRQLPDAYQAAQQNVKHPDDAIPKALADVSLWVLSKVEQQAMARSKATLRPVIILGVIGNIVAEAGEAAEAAGVFGTSEEDYQVAVASAVNLYSRRAQKTGLLNPQELQQAAQALKEKFPAEAQRFEEMMRQRMIRQKGQAEPQQPQEQPQQPMPQQTEQPGMMPQQQGLLGGANV